MLSIDYKTLPASAWEEVAPRFGIAVAPEDIAALRARARVHAKDSTLTKPFIEDSLHRQTQATAQIRSLAESVVGPELDGLLAHLASVKRAPRSSI